MIPPPPEVHPATWRLYELLPEVYRWSDRRQDPPYPLLRYLSVLVDQLGEILDLADAFDVDLRGAAAGGTSTLVDPWEADERWLPWLAQLVGVVLTGQQTTDEQRSAIAGAVSGLRSATADAVKRAARLVLTGARYVEVVPHATSRTDPGGPWDLAIVTRPAETPDPDLVLRTIVAQRAKPAGVILHHEVYGATWDTIEAVRPTWADWEAAGSWDAWEATLPPS